MGHYFLDTQYEEVQFGSVACEYKEDRSLHEVEDPVEDYCSLLCHHPHDIYIKW